MYCQQRILPGGGGNPGVEVDRCGHHETIVVIRVLANQVYATWRLKKARSWAVPEQTPKSPEHFAQIGLFIHGT